MELLRSVLEPKVQAVIFGVFLVCIIAELIWSRRHKPQVYNAKESAANVGIIVGMQVSKALTASWTVLVLSFVYEYRFFTLPQSPLFLIAAFLSVDFLYYWQHRFSHTVRPLWAFHLTHHSSPWMNLTTSFRLNWFFPLIMPFFYLPMPLLGFHPLLIGPFFVINLLFQFWLHTEYIGKLEVLEGVINTPSAHRVHHGSNKAYLDANFGGVLMIWDRMFGTYVAEEEPVVYGVTTGFVGHNPLRIIFQGFIDLARGRLDYKG